MDQGWASEVSSSSVSPLAPSDSGRADHLPQGSQHRPHPPFSNAGPERPQGNPGGLTTSQWGHLGCLKPIAPQLSSTLGMEISK